MKPEKLLAHADFVRSLARSLVIDEHQAADVVQKTWLAALEHPPPEDRPERSWLSRVIKNFAITMYRGESRRKKHEEAAVKADWVPTPEEMVIRKEALRQMTEAVLSLEEPYLTTIMFRFYDDLSAREVAQRLDVPLETVKTRLQRGLKILRERLDDRNGGDRKKWLIALAPFAGLSLAAPTAAAAAAGTAATVSTGTSAAGSAPAVSTLAFIPAKVKAVLTVAVIVGTAIVLHQVLPDGDREGPGSGNSPAAMQDGEAGLPAGTGSSGLDAGVGQGPGHDQNGHQMLAPSKIFISGKVTDEVSGEPVRAYDFKVKRYERWRGMILHNDILVHETVRSPEGEFTFPLEKGGQYCLEVWASNYRLERIHRVKVSDKTGRSGVEIKLEPGYTVTGRVVEYGTNRPVEGAVVGPAMYPWETDLVSLRMLQFEESCIHDFTDGEGRFTIRGLRKIDEKIAAVHPDFAEGFVKTDPKCGEEVVIRLKTGCCIFGRALDDRGQPAADLLIRVYGKEVPTMRPLRTGPDGSYRTPPILAGSQVILKAGRPPQELEGCPDFTEEHKVIDLIDRDLEVNFGPSPRHITWRGTLYGFDGEAKPDGWVDFRPATHSFTDARNYHLIRSVPCDEEGGFEITKLSPGSYRVKVYYPGQRLLDLGKMTLQTPGVLEQDIDLSKGSTLSGVVVDGATGSPVLGQRGYLKAWQVVGSRKEYAAQIEKDGSFAIKGVAPGTYMLEAYVDGRSSRRLSGIKVEKGERITDLYLRIPPMGKVRLVVNGFAGEENRTFYLAVTQGGKSPKYLYQQPLRIKRSGSLEHTLSHEAGSWRMSLTFKGLGYLERSFQILEGQVTDVVVHRNEIFPFTGFIAVTGEVSLPDGTPVQGIRLTFKPYRVPEQPSDRQRLEAAADDGGRFALDGFKPGIWRVEGELNPGHTVVFPQLWIASDSENPLVHDLTMPAGRVMGALLDKTTAEPLTANHGRRWEVRIQETDKDLHLGRIEGTFAQGNRFEFSGVHGGDYQVLVNAEGYDAYQTEAFTLGEGDTLDLGRVLLDPCGLLDLDVVDANLQPVEAFRAYCDGQPIKNARALNGKRRYDKLPLGTVQITVRADGFLEKSISIRIEPGTPFSTRIVLHPE